MKIYSGRIKLFFINFSELRKFRIQFPQLIFITADIFESLQIIGFAFGKKQFAKFGQNFVLFDFCAHCIPQVGIKPFAFIFYPVAIIFARQKHRSQNYCGNPLRIFFGKQQRQGCSPRAAVKNNRFVNSKMIEQIFGINHGVI